ncbi:Uncharacterised protein [Mycobacteroides abscessus subsp. massiliense]|nr:Uncharacterised protein [Mycobacteroides abscessus subsp. massiliense]SKH74861.1 Uncharacterised protein [Mycobacteroides abscessus subsp. massiliense]SKJ93003.1 Uncharacterised protein [Mycobacteroides abscessus subsp. massiliense]SKJ96903.1 Uncharacterised protein [Mycobacteroides abscessus subsp. massiliense]SKK06281.1 Uncharacterised protein [Mycobacteroides abscessus subsp. massiliense]
MAPGAGRYGPTTAGAEVAYPAPGRAPAAGRWAACAASPGSRDRRCHDRRADRDPLVRRDLSHGPNHVHGHRFGPDRGRGSSRRHRAACHRRAHLEGSSPPRGRGAHRGDGYAHPPSVRRQRWPPARTRHRPPPSLWTAPCRRCEPSSVAAPQRQPAARQEPVRLGFRVFLDWSCSEDDPVSLGSPQENPVNLP